MSAPKKKARTMFMHLIDGHPATYEGPDGQVAFASTGRYSRGAGIRLVPSLTQIRAEQRASEKWRASRGFDTGGWVFSYARVEVPA